MFVLLGCICFSSRIKKRDISDVLNEVQAEISTKYSSLIIRGINNVNSGNDEVKNQVKRYIGKYLLDRCISVEGLTQAELVENEHILFSAALFII